jgi:hypothetical protein
MGLDALLEPGLMDWIVKEQGTGVRDQEKRVKIENTKGVRRGERPSIE